MKNCKIQCPCNRGYLGELWKNEAGVPIAFGINKGYLVIAGYCDKCDAEIIFSVTLADLLTQDAPWDSAKTMRAK